jgi:hypothetical protein
METESRSLDGRRRSRAAKPAWAFVAWSFRARRPDFPNHGAVAERSLFNFRRKEM